MKHPVIKIVGGVMALGAILGVAQGCDSTTQESATSGGTQESATQEVATHTVEVQVTSDAPTASVTLTTTDADGQVTQQQDNGTSTPYSKTLEMAKGSPVYDPTNINVVAQTGDGGSTITATIIIDGVQVATNTSTGDYAVVTVTGTPED